MRAANEDGMWYVSEYAEDIHNYWRKNERQLPPYLQRAPQLLYRRAMVVYLGWICEKLHFSIRVKHLAVYYMDMFMDRHNIEIEHLQLIAVGCLILAAKVDERDVLIPKMSELNQILNNAYKLRELVEMEMSVMNFMDWHLSVPTAVNFRDYYIRYSVNEEEDCYAEVAVQGIKRIRRSVKRYVDYFIDLSIQDYAFRHFLPSVVAASSIAAARLCVLIDPAWPNYLEELTRYGLNDIGGCTARMIVLFQNEQKELQQQQEQQRLQEQEQQRLQEQEHPNEDNLVADEIGQRGDEGGDQMEEGRNDLMEDKEGDQINNGDCGEMYVENRQVEGEECDQMAGEGADLMIEDGADQMEGEGVDEIENKENDQMKCEKSDDVCKLGNAEVVDQIDDKELDESENARGSPIEYDDYETDENCVGSSNDSSSDSDGETSGTDESDSDEDFLICKRFQGELISRNKYFHRIDDPEEDLKGDHVDCNDDQMDGVQDDCIKSCKKDKKIESEACVIDDSSVRKRKVRRSDALTEKEKDELCECYRELFENPNGIPILKD